jgi:nucleoside-diphosphate-sugar epimerase
MEIALQNKACLVTGGTGLVGSHVVERLLGLNAQVFVVDLQVLSKSYFDLKKIFRQMPGIHSGCKGCCQN